MNITYGKDGLIPAIVQDHVTNEVLMLAYANEESVRRMEETGETWFWSRSRGELWHKGATSGHTQRIVSIQTDCDSDTLLIRVEQTGFACHLMRRSCFDEVLYGSTDRTAAVLPELIEVIRDRRESPKEGSYTCLLMNDRNKRLKKVIEESGEVGLAIKDDDAKEIAWEMADLLYHLLVVMEADDVDMGAVFQKLAERRG